MSEVRLVDANTLLEKAWDADTRIGFVQVVDVGDILDAPTIDAAQVIRCKNCKHSDESPLPYEDLWCNVHEIYCTSAWFCADGERREE